MKDDLSRRFAYIETCLYWGDGFTAPNLAQVFGIARQNAQKTVEKYRLMYPDNMTYDRSQKKHIATDDFEPHCIEKPTEKYLNYISGIYHVERYWGESEWSEIPFECDDNYLKPPQHRDIMKTVLLALRNQKALHILYRSKSKTEAITVSAHHLVYANYRYHLRAYRHEQNWFADLVLTRILTAEIIDEPWVSSDNDQRWNTPLDVQFDINPELPLEAQQALQADYSLGNKMTRKIKVRHAMLGYICRETERIDWQYGMRLWLDKEKHCYQKR